MEFDVYLDALADGSKRLEIRNLQNLSNLETDQAAQLDRRWTDIDVRRRRRVVQELTDLIEDNVELDFSTVFRRALRDDDPDVRVAAIRGLWENEEPDLIDPYVRLLEKDESPAVRSEAALALGRFAVQAAQGRLRERHFERVEAGLRRVIENRNETDEVRARALEAIGALDAPWVRQAVSEAYESGEHRLKVSAVHAMGRSAAPRWLPLVSKEISSDEAELRYEAAVAAGTIGDDSVAESLLPLLVDEDVDVRQAATNALGEMGGPRAREALMIMLDSESDATREAAAAALAALDFEHDPLGLKFRG